MPDIREHNYEGYRFRAKLPKYVRNVAIGMFVLAVLAVVVGFYRGRSGTEFRLKGEHTQLSDEVIAVGDNYERLESEGDVPKYLIRADHVKTFSDNHQELTNIYLETYDKAGQLADKLKAREALYVPEKDKNFTAYLKGDVEVNGRGRLNLKTSNIIYTRADDTVDANEKVEFDRDNLRGSAVGALVRLGEKRVELLKDVVIESFDSPEMKELNARYAKLVADSAVYDQLNNKVTVAGNVSVFLDQKTSSATVEAARAVATLNSSDVDLDSASVNGSIKEIEFFDNVRMVAKDASSTTKLDAPYVRYDKMNGRYELKQGGHIVSDPDGNPTEIRADQILFDELQLRAALTGSAEILRSGESLTGDAIVADLFPDKKPKKVSIKGNAKVRRTREQDTISLAAPELNALYGDDRVIESAASVGRSTAEFTPKDDKDYSNGVLTAADGITFAFGGTGDLASAKTSGRSTLQLNAKPGPTDAANKRVTADSIATELFDNSEFIRHASAVGNAELFVDPLRSAAENYRTTATAPRFDCEFYPTGNNARECTGQTKTKTVRERTVPAANRGTQVLVADKLVARFTDTTKKVDSLQAIGNAKFTELEQSALASAMVYTESDSTVRLRGGDPTIFDGQTRAKATEIDWNTAARRSYLRGSVSTTYYSRRTSGDTLPFASGQKPVFITSDSAEFDHSNESVNFIGNARSWQDNNYVRADRLYVIPASGRFRAEGNVQSTLYDVRQTTAGRNSKVPVFASANSLDYERDKRVIRYAGDVDIRQGSDRITSSRTDVYLNERNELDKTIAENNVVITQPDRKATGDWAQYNAEDETATLRGSPAIVTDSVNGTSRAGELVFNMRNKRLVTQGKTKEDPTARTRSVYNINPN